MADNLTERVQEALKNPDDPRNNFDYLSLFDAFQATENEEEINNIVDYACFAAGVADDDDRLLYRWFAMGHERFMPFYRDEPISGVERFVWKAHNWFGENIMSRVARMDDEFRRWLHVAGQYTLLEVPVQKTILTTFYQSAAPHIVEELENGPSEDYLEWLDE